MAQVAIIFGMLSIPSFASSDGGLLGNTLNKSSKKVETVTTEVTNTYSEVRQEFPKASEQEKVIQPVTKIVDSVNGISKKVTYVVESETPLVEVDLSKASSIKVYSGVIEAEVSKTTKVKLDTSTVKAEIDNSVRVEVDLVKVDAQVQKDKIPQITVQTPVVNVGTVNPKSPAPETKISESPKAKIDPAAVPETQVKVPPSTH